MRASELLRVATEKPIDREAPGFEDYRAERMAEQRDVSECRASRHWRPRGDR